ncbi:hypothetical protein JAAARDRAFT_35195 [Jaapia argillacea MUCL 33604]|uniref:PHD-type domain-containing protein n=1 Tax=Jaapia argillacea MUCL 33604 TaxID=933084 RepID=A0A067PUF0_9AGAM|nr:hypothetical protein JAAARDRAFT_35195 [Jaapia argillacea MUCL 33604]
MAQAATATMGPPLSPVTREPRRSGRRSTFTNNANGGGSSKSPEGSVAESSSTGAATTTAPRSKENLHRSTSASSTRSKRAKIEEVEDPSLDDHLHPHPQKNGTTNGNGRTTKRKGKEKEIEKEKAAEAASDVLPKHRSPTGDDGTDQPEEEEEAGITRCVCGGSGEDNEDAGEFMVQCETCKVWQHGLCMGYEAESQISADEDYFCEQCRPDLHSDLLKQLATKKKTRHVSNSSHPPSNPQQQQQPHPPQPNPTQSTPAPLSQGNPNSSTNPVCSTPNPRSSRSHSPSHLMHKPHKRRNTMNSRDAAYDESLQEVIEQSAAEAAAAEAAAHGTPGSVNGIGGVNGNGEVVAEDDESALSVGGPKKRKRTGDDGTLMKRTRSTSSASEHPAVSNAGRDPTPVNGQAKAPPAPPKAPTGRNKRGGRKAAKEVDMVSLEGDDDVTPSSANATKRQGHTGGGGGGRAKGGPGGLKRAPPSYVSHASGSAPQEPPPPIRRNHHSATAGPSNTRSHASTSAAASRAYHQTHEYAVSQQPLWTSWHLPDYLAHLDTALPSREPLPLRVQSSGLSGLATYNANNNHVSGSIGGRDSEVAVEGVTIERGVKVKWPAKRMSVADMNKRVRALVEWVGREQASASERMRRRDALERALREEVLGVGVNGDEMMVDGEVDSPMVQRGAGSDWIGGGPGRSGSSEPRYATQTTMKMMEELMEELIGFQEKFGPGAKTKERDRRGGGGVLVA